MPETFDEMKAVCEKLQAANITPFTAIYKDNWTVSQEFCSLFEEYLVEKIRSTAGWIP